MGVDEALTVDERAAERGTGALGAGMVLLATLFGLLASAAGLGVGALTGVSTWVWALGGFLAGTVVAGAILTLRHRRRPACSLRFGPDGVAREVGGTTLSAAWSRVTSVATVPNPVTTAPMVVVATDPADTLVPDERPWRKRAELNERIYDGAVVVPLAATGLDGDELAALLARLSGGEVELASRRARP